MKCSPEDGCESYKRVRAWAESAWSRGHSMGMSENRRIASAAMEDLAREKEEHAKTNARLTELLLAVEEELDRYKEAVAVPQALSNYRFSPEDMELINKARNAVRYFDNGDPMRDVLDETDVEDIICLFVEMLDDETQVPPEQR